MKCLHDLIREPEFCRGMRYSSRDRNHGPNQTSQTRPPNSCCFDGNDPLIITELLDIDVSLRRAYKRKMVQHSNKVGIFCDVASALNYLHLHHHGPIIHRDVSSANVLLEAKPNNQWKAKLSDFDSAKLAREATTTGPGVPVYAAPEVRRETGI